jgi:hypothetical protein
MMLRCSLGHELPDAFVKRAISNNVENVSAHEPAQIRVVTIRAGRNVMNVTALERNPC